MKKALRYWILVGLVALALCACGGSDSPNRETSSAPAPAESFTETETTHVRMSCREVFCKQEADVSRTQSDTGSQLGTYYKVRCWWPCTAYEGQDEQNVWMTFTRFTGECFSRELTTQEDAHASYCEE
jgi:hypothetical protein